MPLSLDAMAMFPMDVPSFKKAITSSPDTKLLSVMVAYTNERLSPSLTAIVSLIAMALSFSVKLTV